MKTKETLKEFEEVGESNFGIKGLQIDWREIRKKVGVLILIILIILILIIILK